MTEPLHVLLVEDDDGDAVLVEDLLAISGAPLALERAQTLAAASRMAPDGIDCVLLDLALPDAEGLEALRHLREDGEAPAIIVLTGLEDESRGAEAVASGAQDYLIKGQVDGGLLARCIRYAVERRRAEQVQQQLQAARLVTAENARLERGLLATPLVDETAIGLATHYQPGRRRALLGGDFYDAVQRPDGSVQVVIADVCGHGPDEAALGVCLRVAWRTLVLAGVPPDDLLGTLEEILEHERHEESVFTTLCMATVDLGRRRAELRIAGHPPPLVLVGDDVRTIEAARPGPPLGVIDGVRWETHTIDLPPGWALLLYTDGLVEGRRGDGRLGEAGLCELVATARRAGAEPWGLLRHVVEWAEEHNGGPLLDDAAALLREGEHADAPRPDLVLLDLNLPRKDGREVLAEVKADPELRPIPVVVLTTSKAEEDILRSYDLHANAYVTKPVDFDRFIEVVRQIDEFFVSVVKLPDHRG